MMTKDEAKKNLAGRKKLNNITGLVKAPYNQVI